MNPPDTSKIELGITGKELKALTAAITHWMVYQRPFLRREVEEFLFEHDAQPTDHSSSYLTNLLRRGFLRVLERRNMGGEHIMIHTRRAERLLGVHGLVRQSERDFMAAIRGETMAAAAE